MRWMKLNRLGRHMKIPEEQIPKRVATGFGTLTARFFRQPAEAALIVFGGDTLWGISQAMSVGNHPPSARTASRHCTIHSHAAGQADITCNKGRQFRFTGGCSGNRPQPCRRKHPFQGINMVRSRC